MAGSSMWLCHFDKGLNNLRERLLHAPEIEQSASEQQHDAGSRDQQHRPWRLGRSQQGPAETVHDANHWIKSVEGVEQFRFVANQARWVGNRRSEHPDLHE